MCAYYCSKYYEKDSLVADPDYGSILSSLLGKQIIRIQVIFLFKIMNIAQKY